MWCCDGLVNHYAPPDGTRPEGAFDQVPHDHHQCSHISSRERCHRIRRDAREGRSTEVAKAASVLISRRSCSWQSRARRCHLGSAPAAFLSAVPRRCSRACAAPARAWQANAAKAPLQTLALVVMVMGQRDLGHDPSFGGAVGGRGHREVVRRGPRCQGPRRERT